MHTRNAFLAASASLAQLATAQTAPVEVPKCATVEETAVRLVFSQVQLALNKDFAALEKSYDSRRQELNRRIADSGNGVKVKTWWGTTSFKLDLPVTSVKQKEVVIQRPEFIVRNKKVAWDAPGFCPVTRTQLDVPQVRCRQKWLKVGPLKTKMVSSCTTWIGPTTITIQTPCITRYDAEIGVPEVSMRPKRVTVGVLEMKMQNRRLSFDAPQITQTDMLARGEKANSELNQLSGQLANDIDKLKAKHLGGAFDELTARFDEAFACMRKDIAARRSKLQNEQDADLAMLDDAYKKIFERTQARGDARRMLDDLLKDREKIVAAHTRAISRVDDEFKAVKASESSARTTLMKAVTAIFPGAKEASTEGGKS